MIFAFITNYFDYKKIQKKKIGFCRQGNSFHRFNFKLRFYAFWLYASYKDNLLDFCDVCSANWDRHVFKLPSGATWRSCSKEKTVLRRFHVIFPPLVRKCVRLGENCWGHQTPKKQFQGFLLTFFELSKLMLFYQFYLIDPIRLLEFVFFPLRQILC